MDGERKIFCESLMALYAHEATTGLIYDIYFSFLLSLCTKERNSFTWMRLGKALNHAGVFPVSG